MSEERIVSYTSDELKEMRKHGKDQTGWEKIRNKTDQEIQAGMDADPIWQELGDDWMKNAEEIDPENRPLSEVLDRDILAFFKSGGADYLSRINAVLRAYMQERQP